MSIGSRLVTTQVVLMIVVAMALMLPLYLFTGRVMQERTEKVQAQLLTQSINMIDAFNESLKITTRQFEKVLLGEIGGAFSLNPASRIEVSGTSTPALVLGNTPVNGNNDIVDRFSSKTGNVATLFVRDGDEFIRIATSVLKEDGGRALGSKLDHNSPAYAQLMNGENYAGRVDLYGRDYITSYSPIKDAGQHVIGATFVGVGATEGIAGLLVRLSKVKLGESGHVDIIDADKNSKTYGQYVQHPKLSGQPVSKDVDANGQPYAKELMAAGQGSQIIKLPGEAGAADHMLSYATYKPWGWMIVSNETRSELEKENRQLLLWLAGGAGLLLVILALALLLFTRHLVAKPVQQLVRQVGSIRDSRDLTQRLAINRKDEVGQVADAMNGLLDSFQQALNRTSSHAVDLDHAAQELSEKAGAAAASSGEQRSSALAMSEQTGMLIAGVAQIEQVASEASDAARASSEAAMQGSDSLVAAVDGVSHISATLAAAADSLTTLESSAKQITAIVNVIHDIADQTNLLALNAAIEAARAGEMGRGFAVVADEVRKLAERTSVSTQEISGMIGKIQSATDEAVKSMRQSVVQASEGAAITSAARQAIGSIVEDSRRAMEVVQRINHELSLQRGIVEQMAERVNSVASQAETSNEAAERSAETARHMAGLADSLKEEVRAFRT
ncbi:methyl-accepting chemotaxis protein [Aquitalea magnusonii]|nr:methyl-accepting chemotaxis protein [Aquitalea magnusonii]